MLVVPFEWNLGCFCSIFPANAQALPDQNCRDRPGICDANADVASVFDFDLIELGQVMEFHHLLARLMSLLFCCALQPLGFETKTQHTHEYAKVHVDGGYQDTPLFLLPPCSGGKCPLAKSVLSRYWTLTALN